MIRTKEQVKKDYIKEIAILIDMHKGYATMLKKLTINELYILSHHIRENTNTK
tara:strand:- start:767 stop:925 length:159 start_codon:yes stop_codon:yes gene_type:complete